MDAGDRIYLIQFLFDSLDPIDPETEKAWAEESEKRLDAYEKGQLKVSDWEDIKKKYEN